MKSKFLDKIFKKLLKTNNVQWVLFANEASLITPIHSECLSEKIKSVNNKTHHTGRRIVNPSTVLATLTKRMNYSSGHITNHGDE